MIKVILPTVHKSGYKVVLIICVKMWFVVKLMC